MTLDVVASPRHHSADVGYCFVVSRTSDSYKVNVWLTKSPTQNCQLVSIGAIQNILTLSDDKAVVQALIRKMHLAVAMSPKLILLDVKNQYIAAIEKCFTVVTKTPYTSTNNSQMCLFIVKLDDPSS